MKSFYVTEKLDVHRRLMDGNQVLVGQLAQNKQAVFFQYNENYLSQYHSLSPFKLPFSNLLSQANSSPHQGLHGVFSDSLPDGWGLFLMDRVFQQNGIDRHRLTAMDRLAYIGDRAMGSLSYSPVSEFACANQNDLSELTLLGENAIQLYDGQSDEVLTALANAGSSAGARPKALIFFDPDSPQRVATTAQKGLQAWLIKFTSQTLSLGYDEGRCEAAYLTMAHAAGIDVPEWQLIEISQKQSWLATKRFDCCSAEGTIGRYHLHSLCGLLDVDFRQPCVDYETLIKVSQILCRSPAIGKVQFTRALFNLFAANQDDHSKNWSFLMADNGQWSPSPFYDVTFSPTPYNEHSTAFMGYGKQPPLKVIQALAQQANFSSWNEAKEVITQVVDAIGEWTNIARQLGVQKITIKMIESHLNMIWKQNKHLLG